MLVTSKNRTVCIESQNDVPFALKQIPVELDFRRKQEPPSTKVVVVLEVDGHITRNPQFDRVSADGQATIDSLLKQAKTKKDDFTLNRVVVQQVFYARLRIRLEYPRIDKVESADVVSALRDRLDELEKDGFILSEPPLE